MIGLFGFLGVLMVVTLALDNFTGKGTYSRIYDVTVETKEEANAYKNRGYQCIETKTNQEWYCYCASNEIVWGNCVDNSNNTSPTPTVVPTPTSGNCFCNICDDYSHTYVSAIYPCDATNCDGELSTVWKEGRMCTPKPSPSSTTVTCDQLTPSGWTNGGESKSTCTSRANSACGQGNYEGCQNAIHDEDDTISCFSYKCKGSTTCAQLIPSTWVYGGESKSTCTANAKSACGEGKYEGCENAIHDEDNTISCFSYRCNGASTCANLIPSGWNFGGESKSTCNTTAARLCGTGNYQGCENAIHDEDDTISCFSYKCVSSTPTPTQKCCCNVNDSCHYEKIAECPTPYNLEDKTGNKCSDSNPPTDPPGDPVSPPGDPTNTPSVETQTCYVCVSGEKLQYVRASSSANAAQAATTLSGITAANCATTSESNCTGLPVTNCYQCNGSKKYVMADSDAAAKSKSGGTSCTIVTTDKCNEITPPKTGTFGIIVAWIVGMMTIGYAMWYYKKSSSLS